MRLNASKTASVYWRLFFRIGTFQPVTADSNKVFHLLSAALPRKRPVSARTLGSAIARRVGLLRSVEELR